MKDLTHICTACLITQNAILAVNGSILQKSKQITSRGIRLLELKGTKLPILINLKTSLDQLSQ